MTKADWLKSGVSEEEAAVPGVYRMIFDAGEWTLLGPNGDGGQGSYSVFRDQIEVDIAEDYTITARWSLDGKTLAFPDIDCCKGDADERIDQQQDNSDHNQAAAVPDSS